MTEPLNVQEMRQRITRACYGRDRVDGRPITSVNRGAVGATLIRNARAAADHAGWSGEDMMTVLAYSALVAYEGLFDRALEDAMTRPSASFIDAAQLDLKDGEKP